MSAIHPQDWGDQPHGPPPGPCFYCHREVAVTGGAVGWHGSLTDDEVGWIVLHADCAERLAAHLVGDVREVRLASGVPYLARRAARALRAATLAQEARR